MLPLSLYIPFLGSPADYGIRALAPDTSQTPDQTTAAHSPKTPHEQRTASSVSEDIKAAVDGNAKHHSTNNYGHINSELPNGKEYNTDKLARLITPKASSKTPTISLRSVELNIPKGIKREGDENGISSSGLRSVAIENQGNLIGLQGMGIKLEGDFDDEVDNAGLIQGKVKALDMGGGNDMLIVRNGARFEGLVDGGSGTNTAFLNDEAGGTFKGATRMELAVGLGKWTLTGPMDSNLNGSVTAGATLINQSKISGTMTVDPGATYSGGTVGNLNVAGTLQPGSSTRIEHDLRMQAGSTLAFTPGTDNTLSVGNTANLTGATLNIHMADEHNVPSGPMRLINAQRVEGQFANITSNLKNFTPELTYKAHDVLVTFKRNDPTVA